VRGFLGLLGLFALLAAMGAVALATILVNQLFHGIWVPLAFSALFALLTGLWPRMKGLAHRGGYALLVASATLLGWASSQEPVRQSPHLWQCCTVALIIGAAAFAAGYLSAKRPPPFIWLFLLAAEACTVGRFSGSVGSAADMVRWMETVLHWNLSLANAVVVPLRKTIHFGFYGFVGFTALQTARGSSLVKWRAFWPALAFALAYGAFDETRQAYAPGRGSSALDVLLDLTGAAVVCFLVVRKTEP
jgi:hypothetical protein